MCKIKKKMDAIADGMYGWVMRQPVSQIKDPKMFAMEAVREFDARMKSLLLDQKLMSMPLMKVVDFNPVEQEELPKEKEVDLKTARVAILDAIPSQEKAKPLEKKKQWMKYFLKGKLRGAIVAGGLLSPEVFMALFGLGSPSKFYTAVSPDGWRGLHLKKMAINVYTGEVKEGTKVKEYQFPIVSYGEGDESDILRLLFDKRNAKSQKVSLKKLCLKAAEELNSLLDKQLTRPFPWESKDFFIDLVKSATAPV